KWIASIPGHVQSEPVLVDLQGHGRLDVVVTTWHGDKCVHTLDGRDGRPLWRHRMQGHMYHGVTVLPGQETRLAAASTAGDVCLLDTTGKEVWTRQVGGYLFAPTAAADLDGDGRPELVVAGAR